MVRKTKGCIRVLLSETHWNKASKRHTYKNKKEMDQHALVLAQRIIHHSEFIRVNCVTNWH